MTQIETPPRSRRSESAAPDAPSVVPGPQPPATRQPSRWRRPLLVLGPIVALVAAGWLYFSGGRYVSEENSYVGATTVAVVSEIAGQVIRVDVQQNQSVPAGATLFVIDPEPYRITLDGARAQLGTVKSQIEAQIATYRARKQQAEQAQANLTFAQQQLQRAQELRTRGAGTQAQLDAARRDQEVAAATLASAEADAQAALAQIGGDGNVPVEQRPQYLSAQAQVRTAERNLRLTEVRAPLAGIVTNVDAIDVGTYLAPGQQTLAIVQAHEPWVDVNVRETDLTFVRAGDSAAVEVDTYPGRIFTGRVESINPASGSVFALIPPQNATGNWVKVVQRIPVRVRLDLPENAPMLRNGMSATVTIDTGTRRTLSTLWRDLRDFF